MIGTIITPAGTRTYVVEDVPELPVDPAATGASPRPWSRRLRGALVALTATALLVILLCLAWIAAALALRPTRVSVRAVGPTAALLTLGPAELLGAAPILAARGGGHRP